MTPFIDLNREVFLSEPVRARWYRRVRFVLGWVFFGLGALGAFLPVLPTTPFMILALWCFSGSSQRFHAWLVHHRLFGPALQRWEQHGVIPLRVKLFAFTGMAGSVAYVALVVVPPWYVGAAMALVVTVGAVYVARRPSRPPAGG
jgi:hypothetical protein